MLRGDLANRGLFGLSLRGALRRTADQSLQSICLEISEEYFKRDWLMWGIRSSVIRAAVPETLIAPTTLSFPRKIGTATQREASTVSPSFSAYPWCLIFASSFLKRA